MATKVCMLLTNPVTDDPRVRREAETLSKAGYELVVVAVRIEGTKAEEELEGYRVIRLPHPKLLAKLLWRRLITRTVSSGFSPNESHGNDVRRRLDAIQQSEQQPPATWLGKCWADVLNVVNVIWINGAMAVVAARQGAAIYHAHDLDTLLAGWVAASWTGGRLVYDFHELFTEQHQQGVKTGLWRTFYSCLERVLISRAHLKLTVCDSLGEWVSHRYGVTGVVTVKNVPRLPSRNISPRLGTAPPIILYHGAYVRNRGLEEFIACVPYLREGRIVLRGTGPLESKLRMLVHELRVQDRVTFAPPVPMVELVRTASEADLGVAPFLPVCLNTRFCLPNKLFEYMMAGLAVVATDVPEMRKIVLGHNIGLMFPSNDPKEMAAVCNELLGDKSRLLQMKKNSALAATQNYNWEQEERRLLQAYTALA